jgi:protein tyrosine phosphatase
MEKSNIIMPLFLIMQSFTSPALSVDKEYGLASSTSSKLPLNLKCDQSIDPQDFEKMVNDHPNHPLIKISTEFLSKKESNDITHEHTDTQHNKNITSLGLAPHIGSRVNNVIPAAEFENLQKNLPCTSLMHNRIINFLNLYQLKTGERKGQYLGANIFNFSTVLPTTGNQHYIATEAPYDKFDYYRMVIDCNATILVSLTTDIDDT